MDEGDLLLKFRLGSRGGRPFRPEMPRDRIISG